MASASSNEKTKKKSSTNLLEASTGMKFASSSYWGPHPAVGLSALLFGVPAVAFLSVDLCIFTYVDRPYANSTALQLFLYGGLCVLYGGVIATCALADYVYIRRKHRSFYGQVDTRFAAGVFFFSIFDFRLRASTLETLALAASAVAAFLFSGLSKSKEQWVFRHCVWHVVASCIGTYGALRLPPENDKLWSDGKLGHFFAIACVTYVAVSGLGVLLWHFFVPTTTKNSLWELGKSWAGGDDCWHPVDDDK